MTRLFKILIALLAALAMCSLYSGIPALAAENDLPDGFLIGDDKGINASIGDGYFLYADDLRPGDAVKRKLTIQNLEPTGSYTLYLVQDYTEQAGAQNFLDNVFLKISCESNVLYEGRLRGDGQGTPAYPGNGVNFMYDKLDLGQFASGDNRQLTAELLLDDSALDGNAMSQASSAKFHWTFTAVKMESEEGPKTGEALQYGMYGLLFLLLIVSILFLVWRKKQKEEERRQAQTAEMYRTV
ncbi:MAG: LPXTG cell wall anchor domain-containing protein [Oscillospiraceae bacterium]|nr:LPXTG cell wall anchor domain-containing protein [Oscillospiraceae bacterium]